MPCTDLITKQVSGGIGRGIRINSLDDQQKERKLGHDVQQSVRDMSMTLFSPINKRNKYTCMIPSIGMISFQVIFFFVSFIAKPN